MNDNYEAMSDLDLAHKVAILARPEKTWTKSEKLNEVLEHPYPYCPDTFDINNWNDIMPIAVEYSFDIEMPDKRLGGIGQITRYQEGDTDIKVEFTELPQRAIAICFLKLKDAQNERI